ncbi:hypothetical protein HYFRA_00002233 [Hymenoscyphus fraxineus]|uniref:DUF7730 domain-containing protein n=1 Tax=Hymenoscyphus fraxineus TaxID=746836 RepID=A0A9N9KKU0_9HELO|nr:hypothetical protein HYFRA_00002233 [Hymenoscyphus fraxineus]
MSDRNISTFKSRKNSASSKMKLLFKKTSPQNLTSDQETKPSTSDLAISILPTSRLEISNVPPDPQEQSQFLGTLPLELRREIYGHVVNGYGTVQHIFLSQNLLRQVRCAEPNSPYYHNDEHDGENWPCEVQDNSERNKKHSGWEIAPLLLTCRKAYLELTEVFFSSTIFRLNMDAAIKLLASFPAAPHVARMQLHVFFSPSSSMYSPRYQAWPVDLTAENTYPRVNDFRDDWESFWRSFVMQRPRSLIIEILDILGPSREAREKEGIFNTKLPWPVGVETSEQFRGVEFINRRPSEGQVPRGQDVDKGDPGPPLPRGFLRGRLNIWRNNHHGN